MITASAPGKLFLFGEYAVLEGHTAMIAAVDRRVQVRAEPAERFVIESPLFATPLVLATLTIAGPAARVIAGIVAAHDLGAAQTPLRLHVDSSALYGDGRKLGFGSSAAVVVAVAGAVLGSVTDPAACFAACRQRHNEAQHAEGSGGDIAASLMGGLTWLRRGPTLGTVTWTPPIAIVTHPQSASTPAFVSHVKAFKQRDGAVYDTCIEALGAIADRALAAAQAADTGVFLHCVREANAALDDLGRASNTPICTPFHRALAARAEALGGAAKPAGAGGGDLSLIAAPSHDALAALLEAFPDAQPLKLSSGLTIYGGASTLRT